MTAACCPSCLWDSQHSLTCTLFCLCLGWRTPYYGERRQEQKEDNNDIPTRRAGITRKGAKRGLSDPDSPSLPKSLDRLPSIPGSDAFQVDTVGPNDCGCTRYEVFSRFDKKSQ